MQSPTVAACSQAAIGTGGFMASLRALKAFGPCSCLDSCPVLRWKKPGRAERAQVNTCGLTIKDKLCHCLTSCRCIQYAPTTVACKQQKSREMIGLPIIGATHIHIHECLYFKGGLASAEMQKTSTFGQQHIRAAYIREHLLTASHQGSASNAEILLKSNATSAS